MTSFIALLITGFTEPIKIKQQRLDNPLHLLKYAGLGLQFNNKKIQQKLKHFLHEKRKMSVSFSNTKYLAFTFQRLSKSKLSFYSYSEKV